MSKKPTYEELEQRIKELEEEAFECQLAKKERERLFTEIKDTLKKVETLRGLIPICSVCKSIRDDKDYWNQVESYIRAHSKSELSHCVCKDCAEKLSEALSIIW